MAAQFDTNQSPPPADTPSPANTNTQPHSVQPQSNGGMWDAFEHILLFVVLYDLATTVALMLHEFVDKWLPGVQTDASSGWLGFYNPGDDWQQVLMRGYLASLFVSLPLFLLIFFDVTKRTLKNPALRNFKARKILIYFTLVITFLIVMGNVIGFIFDLISGNITPNFIMHLLITIGVSGVIFGYYFFQIRHDRQFNA